MNQRPQTDYSVNDWNQEYQTGVYRDKWHLEAASPDLVATVAALGLRSGVALDLGCGTGSDALFLASRGMEVIGVDCSAAALAIASGRRNAHRAYFCEASVCALPLASGQIDFASDRGCLHSLRIEDWGPYAGELARVLRPGAFALIRGCRDAGQSAVTALTAERLDEHFGAQFSIEAVEPFRLCTAHGHMPSLLTLLRRRQH